MKKIVYIFILLAVPLTLNAYTFTRTLSVGSQGQDVLELQKLMNTNSVTQVATEGAGSPGNESMFFGEKTKQAVIKLQNLFADVILKPVGLTTGTGFVGQSTIAFLNQFQNIDTSTNTQVTATATPSTTSTSANTTNATNKKLPIIESVTPENISGGATLTITGKNFSDTNNQIIFGFEGKDDYTNIESTENGTKIVVDYTSQIQKVFKQNYGYLDKDKYEDERERIVSEFPEIDIAVSVITKEGQSNFKIIKFKLK